MNVSKKIVMVSGGLVAIVVVAALIYYIYLLPAPADDITKQEALEKVQAMPEVQEFIAELEANRKSASFNIEDRGDSWSVQVYEIVVQSGESHTATFNWYRVDKKAGAVLREFE
ncbi:MAG: hypothetical protein A3J04_01980 [Candidatus Ryanbacteria bacterium RIFCSPLOWO2_02_FULL_47_14]|uniref:Uncharacterized protein n=1 Tax=Candidatus Ryanbacteria bacterium RIFCSPLOWO2_02_FULL_47_14 TaxID=1802129 RepID=A0A1G2H3P2_9BACT|nr:MAG: hypothetical protein A3J04_01980 [Candidatus Ryanbacteria bacterium RIFCSPLOWO2_02_FULL_47_14]